MSHTSRFTLYVLFFASVLGAAACKKGGSASDVPAAKQTASASGAAPAGHEADNAATDKLVAERNERQLAQDKTTHDAYDTSTKNRLAEIDKALAKVTAAKNKNAAGLRTRRDEVAAQLAKMPASIDDTWIAYTRDVDSRLDGIERDLRAAQ